ncbi:hypothetical protein ACLKA7_006820 [Drosophila subpalustris]
MWHLLYYCLPLLLVAAAASPSPSPLPYPVINRPQSASLLRSTDAEPESICNHCYCHGNTVICDFAHNHTLSSIWNSTYLVPSSIKGMELQLTDRTQLQLHGGLFRQNRVNRFVVKGTNSVNGNDQVELTHNAFGGNLAGYPDIQILGVSSVFVRDHAFSGGEIKLTVENSGLLVLFSSAFINMNMSCNFTNIKSLEIKEKAFNPSINRSTQAHVNLHIQKSNIDQIDSFDVSMNKIGFIDCTIGVVQRSAFNVTNIKELSFENCRIKRIEAYAFTDKLHSEHISITGTQIGTIEGEAIMGSGISTLTFRQNVIDTIKEAAIQVNSVYVYIERNEIAHQGKNWLHVQKGEWVVIENNRFANFAPIQLEQSNHINCSFANNWLGNPQPSSLNFSNCEMRAITVDRVCSCDDNTKWLPMLTDHDLSSELYCQLSQRLHRCFNASTVHLRRYANEACGINRTKLHCVDHSTLEWYNGDFYSKEEREAQQRGMPITLVISIGAGIVVSILIVAFIPYCLKKIIHNMGADKEYCQLSQEERTTLRECEHVPREVAKCFKKLASNKLTSDQCANTISLVMQYVDVIPQSSNRVLANHLQHAHAKSVPGEEYDAASQAAQLTRPSAPSEFSVEENMYSELLLDNEYSSPNDSVDPSVDNVYSEPKNLINDANDMPPAYEAMPQYATLQPQPPPPSMQQQQHHQHHNHYNHHQQLPSTSSVRRGQELPDVLYVRHPKTAINNNNNASSANYATPVWRPTPTSAPISVATPHTGTATGAIPVQPPVLPPQINAQRHVRDLRQNLEAMPQFHPNQLTSARNQSQLQSRFASNPRNNNNNNNNNSGSSGNTMKRSFECLDGAASLAAMEHMDMRGATALPPDSGSDHSGGSDETVKIDDVIEYADAEKCAMLCGKATTATNIDKNNM